MADLQLVSTAKALIYGLPLRDLDDAEAINLLQRQGMNRDAAQQHLAAAITAGAFKRIEKITRAGKKDSVAHSED